MKLNACPTGCTNWKVPTARASCRRPRSRSELSRSPSRRAGRARQAPSRAWVARARQIAAALVADAGFLEHLGQVRSFALDDLVERLGRVDDRNDELRLQLRPDFRALEQVRHV